MKKKYSSDYFTPEQLSKLKHSTPYYLFDRQVMRDNYDDFKALLPGVDIHYAVKSNPHPEVIDALHQHGSGFEIASTHELEILQKKGVSANDILYSAPVKQLSSILRAYQDGIDRFAFDSSQELGKIAEAAPGSKVYLRVFVTEHGSRFSLSEKFGAKPTEAVTLMKEALTLGLQPYGLTFHIGSQATSKATWTYAIRTVCGVMDDLLECGVKIKMLDIGGGFPVQYTESVPTIEDITTTIKTAIIRYLPYKTQLVIEPGRALVATSAVLVSEIFSELKRGRYWWLFIDAGAYNSLFETLESQTSMEFNVYHSLLKFDKNKSRHYTITGPTCDSIDTIMKNVVLPSELKVGDRLYFKDVGAYSIALANSFNGFLPPKAYFIN